ncbi:MAG TPA: penicillin-binding protein 1C [Pseudobdellovibrionaceae bacterium]|nr:penicillin-binding protein 1C [Pseudobdellovibrionaceae bacterium]
MTDPLTAHVRVIAKYISLFLRRQRKIYLYISAMASVLVIFIVSVFSSLHIESFAAIHNQYSESDAWILDRHGYPMETVRTSNQARKLEWTQWKDTSTAFQDLLVNSEDKRFYSHHGVDFLALAQATLDRLIGPSKRGASTLTMQLTGLLKNESLLQRRTVRQKLQQIAGALKLETFWSKQEILEAYINLVPFRGELKGIRAASLGYFGKAPAGLVQIESSILIAMLRSPNASPERISRRACAMLSSQFCPEIQTLTSQILSKPYQLTRSRELIPVISKKFIEDDKNTKQIRTSLDFQTQMRAMTALREQLFYLKDQNVHDGAVVVLETRTGRVVAYAANAGAELASANQVDGVLMRRQLGSTIKPFVYATAFENRFLLPNSLVDDSPADIPVGGGRIYHPKNYDHEFRGLVSAGDALGSSMNVPAVRVLQVVGESRVLDKMRAAGFENLQGDDYYGPSLALGTVDASLWELTQAYRKFAVTDSPFSEDARKYIYNILASSEHRRFTFGLDSILTLPFQAAVKTGTSKDMRDNWCVGWTDEYTVGVWVGNFNGEPMRNVSGMTGAAPIWRSLMMSLHPNPPRAQQTLKFEASANALPSRSFSRIKYPANDMSVAIDPDIPRELQKLPIEIDNPQVHQNIYINSQLFGAAENTKMWPITEGKYLVELKSENGTLIDSVHFEVR